MGDMLGNALSALVSYQRALATTSHNIANADTQGYSRQRVDFATRVPQQMGELSMGSGVQLSSVQRVYDQFAASQLRDVTAGYHQLDSYYQLAVQMDNALADGDTGLSASLSRFYNSIQDIAADPGSVSARQLMLAEANSLADRIADLDAQMGSLAKEVNLRISSSITEINDLAREVADINKLIVEAQGKFGSAANDLLDQREQTLLKLNGLVGITTVQQDDGAVNVFIGNGESLVLGQDANSLVAVPSSVDSTRLEVGLKRTQGTAIISDIIGGGTLGGVLSFRDGLLNETRNELGRITLAVAEGINSQNRAGLDLYGLQGLDIFKAPHPEVLNDSTNTGSAVVTAEIADLGAVVGDNLLMRFDGSAWQFYAEGGRSPLGGVTGAGSSADPFQYQGVNIVVSSGAQAGDEFVVRPTAGAAANLSVVLTDPARIAAAAATRSRSEADNTGSASVSASQVIDAGDPALLSDVEIRFLDASTYQINGAGSYSYSPGSAIDINGNRVVINGTPAADDRFYIEKNIGGTGDNRNALKLAETESQGLLNGGSASVGDAISSLVGDIAVATRSAEINRQSQHNLRSQAEARVQEISGVNLDEEAANLLKFQQAYQAAAQATAAANDMFQALLGAFR